MWLEKRGWTAWILLVLSSCGDAAVYISLSDGSQGGEVKIWMCYGSYPNKAWLLTYCSTETVGTSPWLLCVRVCVCAPFCILVGLISQANVDFSFIIGYGPVSDVYLWYERYGAVSLQVYWKTDQYCTRQFESDHFIHQHFIRQLKHLHRHVIVIVMLLISAEF